LQNYLYGTRDAGFFGYSHFTGGFPGGQAEYVRVPLGEVNLLPIPNEVSDEDALYLSDVLPTSYHCVVDTGVQEGDIVGIWVSSIDLFRQAFSLHLSRASVPLDYALLVGQN
jgi:threonine dehydrogenase-like Zn-dependent dehydrogenase